MSTLYVDNLQPNLGSGVSIPGHVIQTANAPENTSIIYFGNTLGSFVSFNSVNFTPLRSDSLIVVSYRQNVNIASSGTVTFQVRQGGTVVAMDEIASPPNGRRSYGGVGFGRISHTAGVTYSFSFGAVQSGSTSANNYTINSGGNILLIQEIAQ